MTLQQVLDATLPGMGYELVDLELGRGGLVRLFIDKEGGITVEDCVNVSNHLTRVFMVENIDYERLEVSSPGLDRPIKKESDFERFAGREVKVKTRLPIEGRKVFSGKLLGIAEGVIQVEIDRQVHAIPLASIDKARLVPQF